MLRKPRSGAKGPGLSSLPTTGPGVRIQTIGGRVIVTGEVRGKRGASASPAALTLTSTPVKGWADPGVANRAYAFCTFGTVDGFIPSGIDSHVVELDTTSTTAAERRIYLKATWDRPLQLNLGLGLSPLWLSVELLASPTAAIGASVLPAHGTADPATGFREYYILPIGRVRWQLVSGAWQMVLSSDDKGSIRSYLRTTYGGLVASGGPDLPPTVAVNSDLVFSRNGAV